MGTTGIYWDEGGAVFNVMAYGAKGDGTIDDATAIQSTLDAANTAGGGRVYLPQGTYIAGSALTFHSNVYLKGLGICP